MNSSKSVEKSTNKYLAAGVVDGSSVKRILTNDCHFKKRHLDSTHISRHVTKTTRHKHIESRMSTERS